MDTFIKSLPLLVMILLLGGCNGTVSSSDGSDVTIHATTEDATQSGLHALSLDTQDIKTVLTDRPWREIVVDISAFYESNTFPKSARSYTVALQFGEKEVRAYADCQKITAHYKIEDKSISFSKRSIGPAIELASCVESEYADDAVWAFFENSFRVETIDDHEAVFDADDFDTSVTLRR